MRLSGLASQHAALSNPFPVRSSLLPAFGYQASPPPCMSTLTGDELNFVYRALFNKVPEGPYTKYVQKLICPQPIKNSPIRPPFNMWDGLQMVKHRMKIMTST